MVTEVPTERATESTLSTRPTEFPENNSYKKLMTLGQGGQGAVYLVKEIKTGQLFALKYANCKDHDEWRRARHSFRGEIQSLNALRGSISPTIYDFGTINGSPYFVMEHLAGPTLHRHMRSKQLPLEEALLLFQDITQKAQKIHDTNIAHRDIKETNIILSQRGPLYIDFGIAAPLQEEYAATEAELSSSHGINGTHLSAPPEQFSEDAPVRPTLDVYALGVLAYKLFTGKQFRNFSTNTRAVERIHIVQNSGGRVNYEKPSLSPGLVQLIETCTDPKPENRFQTCKELLDYLKTSL